MECVAPRAMAVVALVKVKNRLANGVRGPEAGAGDMVAALTRDRAHRQVETTHRLAVPIKDRALGPADGISGVVHATDLNQGTAVLVGDGTGTLATSLGTRGLVLSLHRRA